ncbi:MAG: hypothetical protein HY532_03720 [Chloroflexi bacterium]|nr:hypothetical protein [Chloroflexota bacterium]
MHSSGWRDDSLLFPYFKRLLWYVSLPVLLLLFLQLTQSTGTVSASSLPAPGQIPASASTDLNVVYDDSLAWENWSWNTSVNFWATSPVYSGSRSAAITYNAAWAGFLVHTSSFSTSPYSALEFAIRPNSKGLSAINVSLYNTSNKPIRVVNLKDYATPAANGWYLVSIPLSALGASNTTITGVQLQDNTGAAQPTYHLDQLQFVTNRTVYDDSLSWENWSWNTSVNFWATSPVYSGSRSAAVTYNAGWAGFLVHTNGLSTSPYDALEFAIHPNSKGLSAINVSLHNTSNKPIREVNLKNYGTAAANGWYLVSIPLSALGASNTTITGVQLQDNTGAAQPTYYLDRLRFVGGGAATSGSTAIYFKPTQCPTYIDEIIKEASAKYNIPRWFYYALIQRESSFNPTSDNGRDKGLTQLGGVWYNGKRYPEDLSVPNDNHKQYAWDMNFDKYGKWVLMSQVTPLTDWFDPKQNLDRFTTGYAVPAFILFKTRYGESDTATWRRVAYHWNKGMYATYDPSNTDYLGLYDKYVSTFKPLVEATDGVWKGPPRLP